MPTPRSFLGVMVAGVRQTCRPPFGNLAHCRNPHATPGLCRGWQGEWATHGRGGHRCATPVTSLHLLILRDLWLLGPLHPRYLALHFLPLACFPALFALALLLCPFRLGGLGIYLYDVYMTKRTNIVLDESLVRRGLKATGLKTRRALVHRALQDLVRREKQTGLLSLRGGIRWTGNLAAMRRNRLP